MKKLSALWILFVCFVVQIYPDENSIEYVNNEALFKFKHKSDVVFKENSYANANNHANALTVFVDKIEFIDEDIVPGYNKNDALIEYINNIKGILVDNPYRIGAWLTNNIISWALFVSPQAPDVIVDLRAIFYNNGYRIMISYETDLSHKYFLTHYPDFVDEIYFAWKGMDKAVDFFDIIRSGNAEQRIQEWYNDFLELIDSIEMTKNYYTSTVNRLSFRVDQGIKGTILRFLGSNDRFEIIEYGMEETINGVQGKWARIITDRGELGWCFDAFITQVK